MKVYTHEDVLKLMNRIHVYEINRDLCMLKLTPIDMEEKLLEYWNGGIKSTEEGGKSFDQYHNEHHEDKLVEKTYTEEQLKLAYMQGYNRGADRKLHDMESYIEFIRQNKKD